MATRYKYDEKGNIIGLESEAAAARPKPVVDGDTLYGAASGVTQDKLDLARKYLTSRSAGDVAGTTANWQAAKAGGVTPEMVARIEQPRAGLTSAPAAGGRGYVSAGSGLLSQFAAQRAAESSAAVEQGNRLQKAAETGAQVGAAMSQQRDVQDAMMRDRFSQFKDSIAEREATDRLAQQALSAARQERQLARGNLRRMNVLQRYGREISPASLEVASRRLNRINTTFKSSSTVDDRLDMFRDAVNPNLDDPSDMRKRGKARSAVPMGTPVSDLSSRYTGADYLAA